MRLQDIIKRKAKDQRKKSAPERRYERLNAPYQKEKGGIHSEQPIGDFTDELTLNDSDIVDLMDKEIVPTEAYRPGRFLSDFRDELTLNDNDIIDLMEEEIPSPAPPEPDGRFMEFRDELTLNDGDIADLSGKEVRTEAVVPEFIDELTLTDEEVVDLTENDILPADAMVMENGQENPPDELTLTDEDVVDLAEQDMLPSETPEPRPAADHELVDELTLTDADISDLSGSDEVFPNGSEEIIVVEEISDDPLLTDEDTFDFTKNEIAFPRENSEILKLTGLAIDALENDDLTETERMAEDVLELTDAEAEAFEEEDTLDIAEKRAGPSEEITDLSDTAEIVELSDTAADPLDDEDTFNVAAKPPVFPNASEEIVELTDVALHSFDEDEDTVDLEARETESPEKSVIDLADVAISALEEEEDTIIDFERRKPAMPTKTAEEVVDLTEIAVDTSEEEEDTIINIDRKKEIVPPETSLSGTEPAGFPANKDDTIIRFDRKKKAPLPESAEDKLSDVRLNPKDQTAGDDDIILFLSVRDTLSETTAYQDFPDARSESGDNEQEIYDEETESAFFQKQHPESETPRETEQEDAHLPEKNDVFSKPAMNTAVSYETLISALQKHPDRIEPFLEQLVRKMISEKIESINIQGAEMNKGKLFDMIQQAISEEKEKLIRGLKGGGQHSV